MLIKFIQVIIIALMIVTLSHCSNPTTPTAKFNFAAAQYLNPDINGNPAPLVVEVYELKTPYNFSQANYTELTSNAAALLGSTLIDKQNIELRPGTQQVLIQPLTAETRYIGITAGFRNIDQATWRNVITVPDNKKQITIAVTLESQNLNIKMLK